jgi:drug/metabolite transporter (DMT)-like permease
MSIAVWLALAASLCTATSAVCQRLGARSLQEKVRRNIGFDPWLVFRLARQPAWLAGFAFMLLGFVFQVSALHFGALALVEPIFAVQLVFVFGYLAAMHRGQVRLREWLAAVAMSAGVAIFLRAAAPSGGRQHAAAGLWWLAGGCALAAVLAMLAAAAGGSPVRRAALLGIATGTGWGFVSAVIKELSSHVTGGPAAVFTNWSAYVLAAAGTAMMLLTAHAMAAGPLAASQPGSTILGPLTACLLGVCLFGEQLGSTPLDLAAEVVGLLALAFGVRALSGSQLITGDQPEPQRPTAAVDAR